MTEETKAHIGWLKVYAEKMTAENWRDMRDRIQRQLTMLQQALETK